MAQPMKPRAGSVFPLVVVVIALLAMASGYFLQSTLEQRRQTQVSLRGLQAAHLAEAAVNRAWSLLQADLGTPVPASGPRLGCWLRLPFRADGDRLVPPAGMPPAFVLSRADLDADGRLAGLVGFMASGTAGVDFDVEVTVRLGPTRPLARDPTDPALIPGVDLPGYCQPVVRRFLEGGGPASFPEIVPGPDPEAYAKIPLDRLQEVAGFFAALNLPFPSSVTDLETILPALPGVDWSALLAESAMPDHHVEKFGELQFTASAVIRFPGQPATHRTIEAAKEFKVVDIQPPAPLYSFFLANSKNEKVDFNSGQSDLFVNNLPRADLFPGLSVELFPNRPYQAGLNFPGLVRVNYRSPAAWPRDLRIHTGMQLMGASSPFLPQANDSLPVLEFVGASRACNLEPATLANFTTQKGEIKEYFDHPETNAMAEALSVNPLGVLAQIVEIMAVLAADALPDQTIESPPVAPLVPIIWAEGHHVGEYAGMDSLQVFEAPYSSNPLLEGFLLAFGHVLDMVGTLEEVTAKIDLGKLTPALATIRTFFHWRGTPRTHLFGFQALSPTLTLGIEGPVQKEYLRYYFGIAGLIERDRYPHTLPYPFPVLIPWVIHNNYTYNVLGQAAKQAVHPPLDPASPANLVPNLAYKPGTKPLLLMRKASHFYPDEAAFLADLPQRMVEIPIPARFGGGKGKALVLNGITVIGGDLGTVERPFRPEGKDAFFVTGQGMLVVNGSIALGCHLLCHDPETAGGTERTVFSLLAVNGGALIVPGPTAGPLPLTIEGSVYTDLGIVNHIPVQINGNWVTDAFGTLCTLGDQPIVINYDSSRVRASAGPLPAAPGHDRNVRASLAALHPVWGKAVPDRYLIHLAPQWMSWRTAQ